MEDLSDRSTFRILVSTDNHLGCSEKDGVRGNDSFNTFEEILQLAYSKKVDFVLFAGDIFHETRPSLYTIYEATRLLRKYCLGSDPVTFALLSDPASNFANTASAEVNYLNPNMNIGIPVFAIHGNHDDPSGPGGLCAVDILHAAGLLNLFGKASSVERVTVNPILLRKGSTHLALYGLGAMREERIHRLFLNQMVTFYRPSGQADDDWFSLCAVHQNRAKHGATSYLPENYLPTFLDLVIWGHEHECRVEPEWNATQNFFVVQPGSSVVTALSEGESQPKAVALLEIRNKEFKVSRLPLRTTRPFIFKDIVLEDELSKKVDSSAFDVNKEVEATCIRHVENCISQAMIKYEQQVEAMNEEHSSEKDQTSKIPKEPLIRLRVDLTGGFESFSMLRFGQRFIGRVANPKDLIAFNHNREKLATAQARRALKSGLENERLSDADLSLIDEKKIGLDAVEVEKLVRHYLANVNKPNGSSDPSSENKTNYLDLFTAAELGRSLYRFVDKDSRDAIHTVVETILEDTIKYLRVRECPEGRIIPDIQSFCTSRCADSENSDHGVPLDSELMRTTRNEPDSEVSKEVAKCTSATRRVSPCLEDRLEWSSSDEQEPKCKDVASRKVPARTRARRQTSKQTKTSTRSVSKRLKDPSPPNFASQSLSDAEESLSLIEEVDSPPSISQSKAKRIRLIELETSSAYSTAGSGFTVDGESINSTADGGQQFHTRRQARNKSSATSAAQISDSLPSRRGRRK